MKPNSKSLIAAALLACALLGGCTAVRVQPVSSQERIEHVCIERNPRVTIGDFIPVMQEGFRNHGITSSVVQSPADCRYTSTYTARRTWDITTYLSQAQIDIQRDGRTIATAHYHLRGKGGLSLNKWAGTRTKILPVMEQLLSQVSRPQQGSAPTLVERAPERAPEVVPASISSSASNPTKPTDSELSRKLSELKDAFDAELITREEYDTKRRALIEAL